MFLVRLVRSNFDDGDVIHDTRMPVVPRVGESVSIRDRKHGNMRFKVEAVDYLLEPKEGASIQEDMIGVRLQVSDLY